MRDLTSRLRRTASRLRVLDQLIGLGAGVVAAFVLATVVLAFGTSTSSALEDVYHPVGSAAD